MATITDISAGYIEYDNGFDTPQQIKKSYITLTVDEPNLTISFHLDELNQRRRSITVAYTDVSSPAAASATALAVLISAMINSVSTASLTQQNVLKLISYRG